MLKKSFTKSDWLKFIFAPIIGIITVKIITNWDKLPFNVHAEMVSKIEIQVAKFDPETEIITVSIANNNYHDIQDVVTQCIFLSESGSVIAKTKLVWLTNFHAKSHKSAKERITIDSKQTHSVSCNITDAKKLNTYMGKEQPSASSIKVSPKPVTDLFRF